MKTRAEERWERMQELLAREASGHDGPVRISSQRTLFGIKSHVEEVIEGVAAEDTRRCLDALDATRLEDTRRRLDTFDAPDVSSAETEPEKTDESAETNDPAGMDESTERIDPAGMDESAERIDPAGMDESTERIEDE